MREINDFSQTLIGREYNEELAKEVSDAGYKCRVVSEKNGDHIDNYMITMELNFSRINLRLEDGLIIDTNIG